MVTVGEKAPDFTLPSDGGKDVSLHDYLTESDSLFLSERQYVRLYTGSPGFPESSGRFQKTGVSSSGSEPGFYQKTLQFPG